MPDNKKKRAPQDKKRVDINDPNEVRNWSKSFGCTQKELKAARKEAKSTYAAAIKRALDK